MNTERINDNESAVRLPLTGIPMALMLEQINGEVGNTGRIVR